LQNLCSIGFTADFWLVKKQNSPGTPGLIVAKLSAEKGLSAAQAAPINWSAPQRDGIN
jgi:hypothetical protein